MSRASSPSSGRRYGTARVCQLWEVPRSTVYGPGEVCATGERPRTCGRLRSGSVRTQTTDPLLASE